ncbi:anaerobic ribonucleoside-triphosphate reductase activating protein [Patescibacteria group bacterium]|nr:anaerobic ribonucleoside-triphosphate reductase activating protein [Patescibacteria group bacterium]
MRLGGFQKTSLIDYPDKVACTIFTQGCDLRCPFCHNRQLVLPTEFGSTSLVKESEVFAFLDKREKLLDGVCITGGEPTLQNDLPKFIKRVKKLGFLIKLDTNGSHPEIIKQLLNSNLLDYIAVDIKAPLLDEPYSQACGVHVNTKKIVDTLEILAGGSAQYEFRTTVVPALHSPKSLTTMVYQLKSFISAGFKGWFLQQFVPLNCLDQDYLEIIPYTENILREILAELESVLPQVQLRI